MESTQQNSSTVHANPNKRFFVSMLTRDIDLQDAILDLLDNCMDGITRVSTNPTDFTDHNPYIGYWAKISLGPSEFSIHDNCGGIPRQVAIDSAFQLGRPNDDTQSQEHLPTIGMYGIGMKRAIFKMGRSARVVSSHQHDNYVVSIPLGWMEDEDNWDLPLDDVSQELDSPGTKITVQHLRPEISSRFTRNLSPFIDELKQTIARFYSVIITKGFQVTVNGEPIAATNFSILTRPRSDGSKNTQSLAPYFIRKTIGEVDLKLWAGIYRRIPDEDEMEKEFETRASRDDAGWTVVCNDRVVIYRDKTRLTGWGDGGVPNYHGQFIGITGVAILTAARAQALPLTTTKRGIDASSDIYLETRKYMQEATRHFTSFTNKWKRSSEDRENMYREAESLSLSDLQSIESLLPTSTGRDGLQRYAPNLPQPAKDSNRRIVFSRPEGQIREVARWLYEDENTSISEVGNGAFEYVYALTRKTSGN